MLLGSNSSVEMRLVLLVHNLLNKMIEASEENYLFERMKIDECNGYFVEYCNGSRMLSEPEI